MQTLKLANGSEVHFTGRRAWHELPDGITLWAKDGYLMLVRGEEYWKIGLLITEDEFNVILRDLPPAEENP